MPDKTTFKIFIASSNELKEERERCILIINQLNKSHKHLHLEPVEWEIDMVHSNFPGHKNIQDAINPKLKESHLVVFIFYSKIGKYTLEEFEFATKENKKLFAYFKKGFSPEEDQLESYRKLLKFKKDLNDSILYKDYDDLDNFEKLFYPNLNLYLAESHPTVTNESDQASVTALSQSNQQLIQLLTAKEFEIKALKENSNQLPGGMLQIQVNALLQEKEAIKNELLQSEEVKKQLAKDKESLVKQLATQIEHDTLKAKAFQEVEKGNYAEAENYLMESAKATASTFFELAKIKKMQLQYSEALHYYELAAKINPDNSLYLNEAGAMANDMGHYDYAFEYYEKALTNDKKIYGNTHPVIAVRYNNIGVICSEKGEYNKAIEYYEKALAIGEKFDEGEHPDIATRYNNIGVAYDHKGEYDKAIDYYKMALAIGEKFDGNEHPDIATRYNNIGLAYDHKGEYDKAIAYYEKALAIDKKFHGDEHPNIATRYSNIGSAYDRKEDYDEAIEYHEKAIAIDKKFYREEHPDIAIRYINFGLHYNHTGEYDKAIKYYEKALAIDQKFRGEEHPNIAINYNNIGLAYDNKEEYDKAIEYYEKALAIDKKFYGEEHPDIATRYNNIGMVYCAKGEYIIAIEFLQKSLAILLKFLPVSHPNIQACTENIEIAKEEQKKNNKA